MTSYSTKATWFMVKRLAPFGGFYIYSYFIIVFLAIIVSTWFNTDYDGLFLWSQTIEANTTVKIVHDVIIFYLIFSYILIFLKYLLLDLDYLTKDAIRLSYEHFFDEMEVYKDLNSNQYRFVLSLLSILSLITALLILHLFTMENGGGHTRIGSMFSGSPIKAIIYTSLMNLAMFFVFVYSFVVWEQRKYVSE